MQNAQNTACHSVKISYYISSFFFFNLRAKVINFIWEIIILLLVWEIKHLTGFTKKPVSFVWK